MRLEPLPGLAGRARDRLPAWATRLGALIPRPKAPAGKAQAPTPVAPDPTASLQPVGARVTDDNLTSGQGPLGIEIRDSANAIVRRQSDLAFEGRNLAREILSRRAGAVTITAWAIRFVIALLWGAIAAQVVWAALSENTAAWIYGVGLVDRDLFRPLIYVFGASAGAGMLAVFFGAGLVTIMGNADNTKVRRIASSFGDRAADLALQFDDHLNKLRQAMNERDRPVEAVSDLSRAHLTALEAAVFFRHVQFLTSNTEAPQLFRGYLFPGGGAKAGGEALVFMSGILVGAFGMLMMMGMPEIKIDLPDFQLLGFPEEVEYWILLGGLIYVLAGLFAELLSGTVAASFAAQAREEALEAARSGFVARQAPRVEDVIRRIEDAMDVYRARVESDRGASRLGSNAGAQSHIAASDDTPSWRKAPEAPRFVDTGFQAAPKTFRTDAFAKAFYENSRRSILWGQNRGLWGQNRGTTSKRGFLGFKKPPGGDPPN